MEAQRTISGRHYGAKPTARFDEETAQQIGEELERIATNKPFKSITAEEAVDAAENGEAPVFASLLTWNNREAARQWRLHQARNTLNHITVIEADEEGEETELRAFHMVSIELDNSEPHRERRYVPLAVVREEESLAEQVIAEAEREFIRARDKLRFYEAHVRAHHPNLARIMDVVSTELEKDV